MARKKNTDEPTVRDGNVVIDEGINRREGLVEYEGTVDETTSRQTEPVVTTREETVETVETPAMQAGSTILPPTETTERRPRDTAAAGDLGMSVDHPDEHGPISMVREGMKVIDASGDEIGKVDMVRMGDPSAVTTAGEQTTGSGNLLTDLGAAVFGTDVALPEAVAARLIRHGFIRVDGKGWIDTDRFVRADEIASVGGDTVTLSVPKERLTEAG